MPPTAEDRSFLVHVSCEQFVNDDDELLASYPEWSATLRAPDDPLDEAHELGTASLIYCRNARWDRSFWARLDDISQDMEALASALSTTGYAADGALFVPQSAGGDLLLIEQSWIDPEAGDDELLHTLIDGAAHIIAPDAVIAVQPWLSDTDDEISLRLLRRLWERGGYVPYKDGTYFKRPPSGPGQTSI